MSEMGQSRPHSINGVPVLPEEALASPPVRTLPTPDWDAQRLNQPRTLVSTAKQPPSWLLAGCSCPYHAPARVFCPLAVPTWTRTGHSPLSSGTEEYYLSFLHPCPRQVFQEIKGQRSNSRSYLQIQSRGPCCKGTVAWPQTKSAHSWPLQTLQLRSLPPGVGPSRA